MKNISKLFVITTSLLLTNDVMSYSYCDTYYRGNYTYDQQQYPQQTEYSQDSQNQYYQGYDSRNQQDRYYPQSQTNYSNDYRNQPNYNYDNQSNYNYDNQSNYRNQPYERSNQNNVRYENDYRYDRNLSNNDQTMYGDKDSKAQVRDMDNKYPQDTAATESDRMLNKKIRNKISEGWFTRSYETLVLRTNNGIVTITGVVDSADDVQSLNDKLKNIDGVKSINNQVTTKNNNKKSY